MNSSTFEEFCGGPFWVWSLLLDNSWPGLTPCFISTVLVWIPCGYVWIMLPYFLYTVRSETSRKSWSRASKTAAEITEEIHSTQNSKGSTTDCGQFRAESGQLITAVCALKIVVTSLLGLMSFTQLLLAVGDHQPAAALLSFAVYAATYMLVAVQLWYERRRGQMAMFISFYFFVMNIVLGIVPLYSWVITKEYQSRGDSFGLFVVNLSGNLVCLVLACVNDDAYGNRKGYRLMDSKSSPETWASYPSRLFFVWVSKVIYWAVKREITTEDVFDLNPRDQSHRLSLQFELQWKKEMSRVNKTNVPRLHNAATCLEASDLIQNGKTILKNDVGGNHSTPLVEHNQRSESMDHEKTSLFTRGRHKLFGSLASSSTSPRKRPNLTWVLIRMEWAGIVGFVLQKFVADVIFFSSPLVIGALIDRIDNSEEKTRWQIYFFCFVLAMAVNARGILFSHSRFGSVVLSIHLKAILVSAIFKKAVSMSNKARKGYTVGDVVNLLSVDCQRIQDYVADAAFILTIPLQIIFAVGLLYVSIGPSMLASILLLLVLAAFNSLVVGRQKCSQEALLKLKDQRMRIVSESLSGMKVLKLYAWEEKFKERVEKIREDEIRELHKLANLYAISEVTSQITSFLCSTVTFATFVMIDSSNELDPKSAFMSLVLFNLLRLSVTNLKHFVTFFVQITVSLKRINDFLVSEDLDLSGPQFVPETGLAISIKDGTFTWDTTLPPTLFNINMNIVCGQLTAVVGPVSVGKSSLISVILGEMIKIHGHVAMKGSVAYVSQQAWIQNATVRDNILFGKEYNKTRYDQVIKACELERDLVILEAGDQTEIGEKGINLSGGQKQRVSLARAVYSNSDIYLLDDPLSAVDSHVGKAIFKNIVGSKGMLADKTRVLVTHGIHWLSQVDHILVLNSGTISEQGSYKELVTHNGPFAKFLEVYLTSKQSEESTSDEDEGLEQFMLDIPSCITDSTSRKCDNFTKYDKSQRECQNDREGFCQNRVSYSKEPHDVALIASTGELDGRLTIDEQMRTGKVTKDVFLTFGRKFGFLSMALAAIFFVLNRASGLWAVFFLADWTRDALLLNSTTRVTEEGRQRLTYYLAVYGAGFGLFQLLALVVYNGIFWYRMVRVASGLHKLLMDKLVRAPMSFFDQTPTGQILNRLSKDVDIVDIAIPVCVNDSVVMASTIVVIFISVLIQAPILAPLLIVVCIVFYLLQQYSLRTTRQLKRMESITRSPVFTLAGEFFSGATIIKLYGEAERFIEEFEQRVDTNQKFFFLNKSINSWLQLSLSILSSCVVLITSVVLVAGSANSSEIGISASFTIQLAMSLPNLLKNINEFQTSVVAVERIQEYSHIEQEAILINPDNRPPPSWPIKGEVTFTDYQTCYRKGLDLVLKGITCHIHGGEKVGIIGRTGAGKSSFALSLFRIIEAVGGSITVDGISLAHIGLHDLRSKLTILPQDPFIFSGSLRSNIDPFEQHTDDQLWAAIERSHLKSFVSAQPEGLSLECGHGGDNLSVGQCQLVCLARSLLRHTKILILDEATAAVDVETDALIQTTIKEAFSDCTIIAIAHRLSTIMDYDRVIVMDDGNISEFDSPQNLINSRGMFYGLCKDAGLM